MNKRDSGNNHRSAGSTHLAVYPKRASAPLGKLSVTIRIFIFLLTVIGYSISSAQEIALKTNLLYDATTTPNIGVETGISNKNTLQLFYGLNPWTFHSSHGDRKARHWLLMPELRWWKCSKFNGHFFGVHLMGGEFNAANIAISLPGGFFSGVNLSKEAKHLRFRGWFAGGGLTYGYQWILNRHWNIEAEIGIGYNHVWYDKYPCYDCGAKIESGNTNYAGVSKLGITLLYIF